MILAESTHPTNLRVFFILALLSCASLGACSDGGSLDGAGASADVSTADSTPGNDDAQGSDVTSPPTDAAAIDTVAEVADTSPDTGLVDTQAPTVAFKSLFDGAKLSGEAAIEVEATDDVGVVAVEFRLNGTLVATKTEAPYTWTWQTTKFASGNWFLSAVAKDGAGQASEPAEVEA